MDYDSDFLDELVFEESFTRKCPDVSSKWTHIEKVVLTGVVMDEYSRRHSLKPTEDEKRAARARGCPSTSLVWSIIHENYETARVRLNLSPEGHQLPFRSLEAIKKRWKELGRRRRDEAKERGIVSTTYQNFVEWNERLNKNNKLLAPENIAFEG